MRERFRMFRRGNVYYCQDNFSGRQESLRTSDEKSARRLFAAKNETKPGALDHARPLMGWTLPECFGLVRRRLEAERDGDGTREYIKVLRLLEKHPLPKLREAVEAALQVGAITRDAVAQFLYPREDWRATLFSLDGHPHLRHVRVATANLAAYRELVGGAA